MSVNWHDSGNVNNNGDVNKYNNQRQTPMVGEDLNIFFSTQHFDVPDTDIKNEKAPTFFGLKIIPDETWQAQLQEGREEIIAHNEALDAAIEAGDYIPPEEDTPIARAEAYYDMGDRLIEKNASNNPLGKTDFGKSMMHLLIDLARKATREHYGKTE